MLFHIKCLLATLSSRVSVMKFCIRDNSIIFIPKVHFCKAEFHFRTFRMKLSLWMQILLRLNAATNPFLMLALVYFHSSILILIVENEGITYVFIFSSVKLLQKFECCCRNCALRKTALIIIVQFFFMPQMQTLFLATQSKNCNIFQEVVPFMHNSTLTSAIKFVHHVLSSFFSVTNQKF